MLALFFILLLKYLYNFNLNAIINITTVNVILLSFLFTPIYSFFTYLRKLTLQKRKVFMNEYYYEKHTTKKLLDKNRNFRKKR